TVVAVDGQGRQLATRTVAATTADHLALLRWAEQFGDQRRWAVEDCRHLSRRLERDLLGAGAISPASADPAPIAAGTTSLQRRCGRCTGRTSARCCVPVTRSGPAWRYPACRGCPRRWPAETLCGAPRVCTGPAETPAGG